MRNKKKRKWAYVFGLIFMLLLVFVGIKNKSNRTLVTNMVEEQLESEPIITEELRKEENQIIAGGVEDSDVKKKIALTFDDGPNKWYTEKLLDGLKERGVIATFFVIGCKVAEQEELMVRMAEDGHLIGNHTYTHMMLEAGNEEEYKKELELTNTLLQEITGEETLFVRPPYGVWNEAYEEELNMIPVFWTVDPLDWCTLDVGTVVSRVISEVEENDIILLHDDYETSVIAALEIVDILLEEGYQFVTVDDILLE